MLPLVSCVVGLLANFFSEHKISNVFHAFFNEIPYFCASIKIATSKYACMLAVSMALFKRHGHSLCCCILPSLKWHSLLKEPEDRKRSLRFGLTQRGWNPGLASKRVDIENKVHIHVHVVFHCAYMQNVPNMYNIASA